MGKRTEDIIGEIERMANSSSYLPNDRGDGERIWCAAFDIVREALRMIPNQSEYDCFGHDNLIVIFLNRLREILNRTI